MWCGREPHSERSSNQLQMAFERHRGPATLIVELGEERAVETDMPQGEVRDDQREKAGRMDQRVRVIGRRVVSDAGMRVHLNPDASLSDEQLVPHLADRVRRHVVSAGARRVNGVHKAVNERRVHDRAGEVQHALGPPSTAAAEVPECVFEHLLIHAHHWSAPPGAVRGRRYSCDPGSTWEAIVASSLISVWLSGPNRKSWWRSGPRTS